MAFPAITSEAESWTSTNENDHDVYMPSGLSSGDLLLILAATDGDISWSDTQGCTELFQVDNGTACSLTVFYKKATGSEGSYLTFVSNEKEQSAWCAFRITGMADPATDPPEASSGATGSSDSPDPDSLTASWGAEDNLWFAICGKDDNAAPTVWPLPDNQNDRESSAGSNSCNIAWCTDDLNQATLNPSTFTIVSEQWIAATLVIRPVPGGETIQITKGNISVAGQALGINAETNILITKGNVALAGQALVVNAKELIPIAEGSISVAGKNLNVKEKFQIAAGSISVAGQTLVVNAKEKIAITKGNIAVAGQALVVNAKETIAITKGNISVAGQNLVVLAAEIVQIAAGAIAVAGQAVVANAEEVIQIVKGNILKTGQALVVNASTIIFPAAASISVAGQALVVNAREKILVTAGAISVAGQSLVANMQEVIQIVKGNISVVGQNFTVWSGEIVAIGKATITVIGKALYVEEVMPAAARLKNWLYHQVARRKRKQI